MGTIKDRHGKDLIETEEIQERWKEYRELYKKDLNDPDNHHGVVIHPEPDILKCGVERVLWSTAVNKASEGNGIPAELFKILKDGMLSKRCTQYESKFGKYSSGHCTDKGQSSSHFPRTKECSIALISQASKVTLKIMHVKPQHYINGEFPDVQAGFRKDRGNQISDRQHLLDHR